MVFDHANMNTSTTRGYVVAKLSRSLTLIHHKHRAEQQNKQVLIIYLNGKLLRPSKGMCLLAI